MIARLAARRPVLAMFGLAVVLAVVVGLGLRFVPGPTTPVVEVRASYPGAGDDRIDNEVAMPIIQQISGVRGLKTMSPRIADGQYTLTIEFETGSDPALCRDLVQNRVALAEPILPEAVRRSGVTVALKPTNSH